MVQSAGGSTGPATAMRIRIPGRRDEARNDVGGVSRVELEKLGLQIDIKDAVRIEATRALADGTVLEDVAPDTVVEVGLQDGVRLFMLAAEVADRLGGAARRSVARPGEIELSASIPLDTQERALGAWAIEGLRLIGVDLPEEGAKLIARKAEDKLVPSPGLYRWTAGDALTSVTDTLPAGTGPWLLFLHGTASNTRGSFGGLVTAQSSALWNRLSAQYGDRVLALEHRTLTESPIENALQALQHLPQGAILHLVSHSRGGLIGELLCRATLVNPDGAPLAGPPFDQIDFDLFTREQRAGEREQLENLCKAIAAKRPTVARFVRVACPARGTTLVSARLDRWLNAMLATLGVALRSVPALGEVYDALQALLLAVVKERTDPRTLPGLEAMIPDSPVIKILNRPDLKSGADLSVIKGDCVPSGVLRRLVIWFADAFYGEDHDLVINTSAMVAGLERSQAREFFAQGPAVDHFHYFLNPQTAEQVTDGLLRKDDDLAGFETLSAGEMREMPVLRSGARDRRPIVFVLPGITGNHLSSGGQRVWIDPLRLAMGGLKHLAIGEKSVVAGELVGLYYADLCAFLDETHEVRPWPYDWRQPILDTAGSFAAALRTALDGDRPVRIVAHSMGGLVARAAMLDAEVWGRFKSRDGARLVMLGTPNGGSHGIPFMLLGRNKLMRYLAALDLTAGRKEHLEIVSRWPGALHLLPAESLQVFDATWWASLRNVEPADTAWTEPNSADLVDAEKFREAYAEAPFDPDCMVYVAGQADTIDGIVIEPTAPSGERIRFTRTREGDGQVTWKSGIPPGMRVWYAQTNHGDLARHEPAFAAIADLLHEGTTTRLPDKPPAILRGLPEPMPLAREEAPIHPSAEDLALAGLGGVPRPAPRARLPRIRVSVMLGHLAFARHPVLIGHYAGDTFAGTEALLDRALEGRLEARRRMGLYPGPVGTSTVVLDASKRPKGAVVVGLGEAGNLAAGILQDVLYRGLAAYVAAEEDRRIASGAEVPPALGVSALLVGSSEGGLPRPACVLALLRAADRLQRLLASAQPADRALASLQIVEAVEYRAIEIWHALDDLLNARPELSRLFELTGDLEREQGAIRTVGGGTDRDWWIPLQITMEKGASGERTISFVSAAGRARAEASLLDANLAFVERFVGQAIAGAGADDAQATPNRALFELLWPVRLKRQSGEDRNLRMILDVDTAAFPWELMNDRHPWAENGGVPDQQRQPFAVRSGVIRQLIQTRFREAVTPPRGPRKALVVGDPRAEPAFGFAELAGAQDEARAVAIKLRERGYAVTELIGSKIKPEHVVMHLFAEAWEVIHIAAHGVFEEELPQADGSKSKQKHTGIVLGGGLILGPSVLAQLSVVPSLVFVNCCHQGHIDPAVEARAAERAQQARRPALAASVAVELISLGVRGVVAAGWAVDDMAAERFANAFYERLLAGDALGAAAQNARQAAYDLQPRGTTWGAYQCYGEPDWCLSPGDAGATPKGEFRFASVAETVYRLDLFREELNVGLARDVEGSRRSVTAIQKQAKNRGWDDDPTLLAALAATLAELGDLDAAVASYDRAIKSPRPEVPIRAVEQHANLRARLAVQTFKVSERTGADRASAAEKIRLARENIENLASLAGDTLERWSLRGSCWKRLAQIEQGEARDEALQRMAECYDQAKTAAGKDSFYPQLQWAAAGIARKLCCGHPAPRGVRLAVIAIAKMPEDPHDFWRDIASADANVLGAILEGAIDRKKETELLAPYLSAWRFGGSPLKLMSVLDQFTFFEDVLADAPEATKPVAEALGRMRSMLDSDLRRSMRGVA